MPAKTNGWILVACLGLGSSGNWACDGLFDPKRSPSLSVGRDNEVAFTGAEGSLGPKIGAVAHRVSIRAKPSASAPAIGFLTAGAIVNRSDSVVGREGCAKGWYEVEPRGYLCLDGQTTLEVEHPTLHARALAPSRTAPLPYPYAIARRKLTLFEPDPEHRDGVRERGKMGKGAVFAIVGSWETLDEYDQRQRLAMLTFGSFVAARDIEPLGLGTASATGLVNARLPIAIPLGESTSLYRFTGTRRSLAETITARQPLPLTPRSRSFESERYLQLTDDRYVAERDVAVVRQRNELPSFVTRDLHWVDVDTAQSLLVLYVGERPQHAMRMQSANVGDLSRGVARVKAKQITELSAKANLADDKAARALDIPWVVELDTGVTLRSAITTTPAEDAATTPSRAIEFAPEDASLLFRFLAPAVPDGWHGVTVTDLKAEASVFLFR